MHPAELGEKQAVVALIEFDLLRVRVAEAVALPLFPEARKRRAFGEEVAVGPLQILQGLLQGMDRRIGQPYSISAAAPAGERLAQPRVAQLLLATLIAFLLQRQCLVVDEPA